VDPDRITAEFNDGLLRLEVPKAHPRPSTRVRVDRAE
jgi:HSP20 family molecular chaperone IbpA